MAPADTAVLVGRRLDHDAQRSNGTPDFLHVGRAGAQAEAGTPDVDFFAPTHHRNK